MPQILDSLHKTLMRKGYKSGVAWKIATAKLQETGILKPGTNVLTEKGKTREKMGSRKRRAERKKKYGSA
jgi:hypothetical protein